MHHTKPHSLRILQVENLFKLTTQNMKHRDDRIKDLMDQSHEVQDKLTEITDKISNYEKQINNITVKNNRSSTPFRDISVIYQNKNLKIPIFAYDSSD